MLAQPGYDVATGLYLEPVGDFPPVPETPTSADVDRALRALLQPVQDFPFTNAASKAGSMISGRV